MLTSLALLFLFGLSFGWISRRLGLPSLVGMILAGILIGPYSLGLLSPSLLAISADLRQLALIIILTRAGLTLDLSDLKKIGRPAFLLCFVPACFEIAGAVLLAPALLDISRLEAAVLGAVIAAVSPAVIVPRMIGLIEEGYGKDKAIPQMILAGASVDDVFVIVVFYTFLSLLSGGTVSAGSFLSIPVSILSGIAFGALCGWVLHRFFSRFSMAPVPRLLIYCSVSFLTLELEQLLKGFLPLSGLLSIMACGIALRRLNPELAQSLCKVYNNLWGAAEIWLFVLVGATVDLRYALAYGAAAILLVAGALVFRMGGVALSVSGSGLRPKEKLFAMIAYTPKATVQAAIGAIPLSMGLACGQQVLTVAVLSILLTAPLGAALVDRFGRKWLSCPASASAVPVPAGDTGADS